MPRTKISEERKQQCLNLRWTIDKYFGIASAAEGFVGNKPGYETHFETTIRTKDGMLIQWDGIYFTDSEYADLETDHVRDVMLEGMSPEEEMAEVVKNDPE